MTKVNMIEILKENAAHAWYRLAEHKYEFALNFEPHCGSKFINDMIEKDEVYNRLLGAWNELHVTCNELGIDYSDNEWEDKAFELNTKLFQRVREI